MDELKAIATRFRRAIEETDRGNLPIQFKNFPAGACGDTSLLLGFYLKQQGAGAWDYVSGMRGEGDGRHSHAWIKQGDIIIDITADQFDEIEAPVIVTNASPWHDSFDTEILHEADFHVYDQATIIMLSSAYANILDTLEH